MAEAGQEQTTIGSKGEKARETVRVEATPSGAQLKYLKMGLAQSGGKLPLFDSQGQGIKPATIRSCIEKGWAEPWFNNPVKPDWLVCKLTESGRKIAS